MKAMITLLATVILAGCAVFQKEPSAGQFAYKCGEKEMTLNQPQASESPTTFEITPDGTIIISFGTQRDYMAVMAAFDNVKIYHYSAVALLVAGIAILFTSYVRKLWGVVSIASSIALGCMGHFIPKYGILVAGVMLLGFVAAVVYLLVQYPPKGKRNA